MVDPGQQPLALADRLQQPFLKSPVRRRRDDGGERAAGWAVGVVRRLEQHGAAKLLQELLLLDLLQHAEASRHVRLERKLLEKPRAKAVDGLHLEAAGRLQRGGEQAAGALTLSPAARLCAGGAYRLVEPAVVERDPFAQRFEDAVRHVGGRRLGEGEAEDFGGIGMLLQQQPDDALRQHVGLAGAGVGRHPGRDGRVRCGVLVRDHRGRRNARAHSVAPSSSSAPPDSDHSRTRAR